MTAENATFASTSLNTSAERRDDIARAGGI